MTASRLTRFLYPQSIAIVGASETGMYPAGILADLMRYGFPGQIYPVNPRRERVLGLRCYANLTTLPEVPDLAIVVVPRQAVLAVIDECIATGVKAALLITAGFRESDAEGARLEALLKERLQGSGLAVIGPNCAGLANLAGRVTATRLPAPPKAGSVSFVSASGALMMAMQGIFADHQLGLSHIISLGNQVDVTLTETLAFLVEDPATRVIGAFIEGIDDGRRFAQVAAAARQAGKPLVVVKSGRTQAGQQAAATHTAAMATSDRIFSAICRQTGVVLVNDISELVQTLDLFSAWIDRLPAGRRLGLVTQSGGMGSLAADLATLAGLELPALPQSLQETLHTFPYALPFDAFSNPADVRGAGAVGQAAADTLRAFLAAEGAFDSVVLLLAKSAVEAREAATANALATLSMTTRKPFCVVWTGQRIPVDPDDSDAPLRTLAAAGVPVFDQPGDCIRALNHVISWHEQQQAPADSVSTPRAAPRVPQRAPTAPPRMLAYAEISQLFKAYSIDLAPATVATCPDEAVVAADRLGYPVAVKGLAAGHSHKSEAGLVRLNLTSPDEVHAATQQLWDGSASNTLEAVLVQRMAPAGVEVLIGVENDPHFGPVLACGPGGVLVELLDDVSLRLAPITAAAAHQLFRETRLARLLAGFRGAPPADSDALARLLAALSVLAAERSDRLVSLDLNPVIVHAQGLSIVDARIEWRGDLP
ncbi:MAG: acetate--CoA ligase family protein [Caldilineaceae bacterium]|nr:acetate--CoA ligase family protein [Caldilineaceae bacterium]